MQKKTIRSRTYSLIYTDYALFKFRKFENVGLKLIQDKRINKKKTTTDRLFVCAARFTARKCNTKCCRPVLILYALSTDSHSLFSLLSPQRIGAESIYGKKKKKEICKRWNWNYSRSWRKRKFSVLSERIEKWRDCMQLHSWIWQQCKVCISQFISFSFFFLFKWRSKFWNRSNVFFLENVFCQNGTTKRESLSSAESSNSRTKHEFIILSFQITNRLTNNKNPMIHRLNAHK